MITSIKTINQLFIVNNLVHKSLIKTGLKHTKVHTNPLIITEIFLKNSSINLMMVKTCTNKM